MRKFTSSRPCHRFVVVHLPSFHLEHEELTVIERVVGEKDGKYIWAFINGIDNTKKEALASAELISSYACDEKVFALQNDTLGFSGILDFLACFALKSSVNMPVVGRTTIFLRHLLSMSEGSNQPIIIFAHSQGAIIVEQALSLLKKEERVLLRIFTFGAGSMIPSGMSHPDSHNFANVRDFICMLGSPNWQILALERYHGQKQGKTEGEILWDFAMRDALLKSDSLSQIALEAYAKGRIGYYEKAFNDIKNLTVLDFEADAFSSHEFKNDGYQKIVKKLIKEYRESMQ